MLSSKVLRNLQMNKLVSVSRRERCLLHLNSVHAGQDIEKRYSDAILRALTRSEPAVDTGRNVLKRPE